MNKDASDLVIRNATVVTADQDRRVIADGGVAVSQGRIVAVGTAAELAPWQAGAARVIDASGMILMPGLINTHCHAGDSLFRGLVEDLPLEAWLQTVWKAEGAILNAETSYLGTVLGFAEQLLTGVTTVMDMFWFPHETVRAARTLGMRVSTGGIFFDPPGVNGHTPDRRIAEAERFFADFSAADDVFAAAMPHGAYTVSPESLKRARQIADSHGGLYSIHAAETRAEQADIQTRYGRSVIRHLDAHGLLDERTVLAHCVHLDDEEIAILARTRAVVSHNPVSNLKLGSGIARIPDMLAAGVRVTLGTDGAISGNDLDMWLALRLAAMLHKGANEKADAVATHQALDMLTREAADALGAGEKIGSLETGKFADMVLLDASRPHAVPMFDPVTHLVYSAGKSDVRHVFLAGEQVVADGRLVRLDLGETLAAVRALTPTIAASIA
ncbi:MULTISPECIES: amidohydrolase family protein [Nitratireductor]|uniref:amidohydrolase family protein n=1 Tax=Nitratireductor TaxID=245876 RepID=UPI000D0DB4FB|nr:MULTISPECIES: amidohydrolase [Nitratireductor]PSM19355.1 amidohydrolase [Nitratireductor sp. StC3]